VLFKVIFLYVPAALLAGGLLAFCAFHAWPLSPVGQSFGRQPGYFPGYAEPALLLGFLLWYVAGYAAAALLLSRFSGGWTAWARVGVAVATSLAIGGFSLAGLFGAAMGGGRSSGGFGLGPITALSDVLMPATVRLRRAHYVARLGDADARMRSDAASGAYLETRRGAKGDGRFQSGIARALRTDDAEVRHELTQALVECYPLAPEALHEVVARLEDATDGGRVAVADLLGTLGAYGQPEPELRDGLLRAASGDPARPVREAAVRALLRSDRMAAGQKTAPGLQPVLERWIGADDPFAATALSELAGAQRQAAAAFARGLASPDPARRQAWIRHLGDAELGPPALDVEAAVDRALADPDAGVRAAAVELLASSRRFTVPRGQLALARALRDRAPEVRAAAMHVADEVEWSWAARPVPAALPPALAALLADPEVGSSAGHVLEALARTRGPGAAEARRALAAHREP
jgi:hypothetical protein